MIYNYRFELAAIVISIALLINFLRQRSLSTYLRQCFIVLVVLVLFSSSTDILAVEMLYHFENYSIWQHYLVNTLYYISFNTIPVFFYLCIYFSTRSDDNYSRKHFILYHIPYYLSMLMIITSPLLKQTFYIDNEGFHSNWGLTVLYVLALYYDFLILGQSIVLRRKLAKGQLFPVIFYSFTALTAAIIQFFYPQLLILGFVVSISAVLLSFSLDNPVDYIDSEMNIYNRQAFIFRFKTLMRKKHGFTLLGLRITEMKNLNNTIGPAQKEDLLHEISLFFTSICEYKNVFRISRSNCVLILSENSEKQKIQIETITERMHKPFESLGYNISLTVLMDLIHCPSDANNVKDAIDLIEISFTDIISSETTYIVNANKEKLQKQKREQKIIQTLNKAIDNNSLEVFFNPVYSFKKKKFKYVSTTIKLKNSEIGDIPAEELLTLAEKNGLILRLFHTTLSQTCKLICEEQPWKYGIEAFYIQMSAIQCMQKNFCQELINILDSYRIDYRYLIFELSETDSTNENPIFKDNIKQLIDNHIQISMDHFGTGLSNAVSLIQYPYVTVKFDETMLNAALENKKSYVILSQTVSMLKDLNFAVGINNIETKEQEAAVIKMKCDYAQGKYYSDMLNKKDFIAFIKNQKQ